MISCKVTYLFLMLDDNMPVLCNNANTVLLESLIKCFSSLLVVYVCMYVVGKIKSKALLVLQILCF